MSQQVELSGSLGIDHGTLVTWVNEADDLTIDSRAMSEKSRDYYDSKQWTESEKKKLKTQKQAATVSNRIKPKMDTLMGMEKAAKTTCKAFPRTPKHEQSAEAATEAIRFVLHDTFFDQVRSAVWECLLIEGTGGCDVIVEPHKDEMRIRINPIFWDRLIYDPHSRRKDFSDARFLGQVVWMDYDLALEKYPKSKDVLESFITGSQTYDDKPRWYDSTRRRVKIVELYYRDKGEMYYACFTRGGYCEEPKISPYKNEEGETEWCYEFASAFVTREGERYGAAYQLLDVQDEINKRRSKALHLMSVRQTFSTQMGTVEDLNKARQELAKPDGHVQFQSGEFGKDFGILPTGDMAQAQFKLLEEAKMEIDAVGANSAVQGKDKTAVSGVALAERRSAGQTEVGPLFDVLRYWQLRVYRKVWNRIRQYWKAEKWIRVTDDENNLRWVGLNAPIARGEKLLRDAREKGIPAQQLQMLQQQISQDPSMAEMVTENEISDLDVDIILSEVPDVLTAQIEDFQTLGEMVKSGFQLPPKAVIEASPLSNKDKILKIMDEQPQIPPQVQEKLEQMGEEFKKVQQEAQKLAQENQALKADQQTEQAKIQSQHEAKRAELSLKAEVQAEELRLEREKVTAQIQLEREKAQAQLEIEGMRMQQENQQAQQKMAFEQENAVKEQENTTEFQAVSKVDGKLETLTEALGSMTEVLQQILGAQQQTNEALNRPKKVAIGGVQRTNGQISGATVSVN